MDARLTRLRQFLEYRRLRGNETELGVEGGDLLVEFLLLRPLLLARLRAEGEELQRQAGLLGFFPRDGHGHRWGVVALVGVLAVVEDGVDLVVLLLREGVVLVVVALRAGQRTA